MAATIGEQLRLAREDRGIPLREISDHTRISVHYLEAIETNDYKRLPGGIFNRSFVKAYAKYVGYDEKDAIDGYARYMRESGNPIEDVVTTPLTSKVYTDAPATRSPVLTGARDCNFGGINGRGAWRRTLGATSRSEFAPGK